MKRTSYRNSVESLKSKTNKTENGCWEWLGCKTKDGYGRTMEYPKSITTHRLMYKLANNVDIEGKHVLHKCDNPPCINPKHLELGDHKINMAQMTERGRRARLTGSKNPAARLSTPDVEDIKLFLKKGISPTDIAKVYPVGRDLIYHIKNGRAWNNV